MLRSDLLVACREGNTEGVKRCLADPNINPNGQDIFGYSPFYVACFHRHIKIVKLLLKDERVDVKQENIYGASPFLTACQYEHLEVVKLLLADERVDINQPNMNGRTPLMSACTFGSIDIVKLLLVCGREVDVVAEDCEEKTALDRAIERKRSEIVELIEQFILNPIETRAKLRKELGYSGKNSYSHLLIDSFNFILF